MEHGPIPPHERSWRHPSELAPTRSDIDLAPRGRAKQSMVIAAASGTLAIAAVAVLLVTVTPERSGTPLTLSATTSPPVVQSAALPRPAGPIAAQPTVGLASFTPIPLSVTPQSMSGTTAATTPSFADEVPALDDTVFVLTENAALRTVWGHLPWLSSPDDATVVDASGEVVAYLRGSTLFIVAEVHVDD